MRPKTINKNVSTTAIVLLTFENESHIVGLQFAAIFTCPLEVYNCAHGRHLHLKLFAGTLSNFDSDLFFYHL